MVTKGWLYTVNAILIGIVMFIIINALLWDESSKYKSDYSICQADQHLYYSRIIIIIIIYNKNVAIQYHRYIRRV